MPASPKTFLMLAALAGLAASCGGGAPSRTEARDEAATKACAYFQKCGQVGDGQTYATLDDCKVSQTDFWNGRWPTATCDGKINEGGLGTCLSAIDGTVCGNGLDVLNTAYNKCSSATVCAGN